MSNIEQKLDRIIQLLEIMLAEQYMVDNHEPFQPQPGPKDWVPIPQTSQWYPGDPHEVLIEDCTNVFEFKPKNKR